MLEWESRNNASGSAMGGHAFGVLINDENVVGKFMQKKGAKGENLWLH